MNISLSSCQLATFNPRDPYASSIENEFAISPHCIPNLVKICVFAIHLVLFSVTFILALRSAYAELRIKLQWSMNLRRMLNVALHSLSHVILFSLLLSGSQNVGKYVFYPFGYSLMVWAGIRSNRDWFRALHNSHLGKEDPRERWWLNLRSWSLTTINFVGFFVWWMILPIIFYHDPFVLNWSIVIGYVFYAIIAILAGWEVLRSGRILLKNLEAHEGGRNVAVIQNFSSYLKKSHRTTLISLAVTLVISCVLIIWIVLTQTSDNPGMQYFFYFEFLFSVPFRFSMGLITILVTRKRESTTNITESDEQSRFGTALTTLDA